LIEFVAGPEEAKNLAGGGVLRLIRIRLAMPSFEKISLGCQDENGGNFVPKTIFRWKALQAADPTEPPRF
jgi:hypothetical protein